MRSKMRACLHCYTSQCRAQSPPLHVALARRRMRGDTSAVAWRDHDGAPFLSPTRPAPIAPPAGMPDQHLGRSLNFRWPWPLATCCVVSSPLSKMATFLAQCNALPAAIAIPAPMDSFACCRGEAAYAVFGAVRGLLQTLTRANTDHGPEAAWMIGRFGMGSCGSHAIIHCIRRCQPMGYVRTRNRRALDDANGSLLLRDIWIL
jgi:hypothetical protein